MLGLNWRPRCSRRARDVSALQLAVKSAEESALKAASLTETAVRLIQELEEHQQDATPTRFRRLTGACICIGIMIFASYWFITPAFSHPSPRNDNPGGVSVIIETPAGSADKDLYQSSLREVVVTSTLNENDSHASYSVSIPALFEGLEFKILLTGSAALDDLGPTVRDEFEIEENECSGDDLVPNAYLENSECQVFGGIVGGESTGLLQDCNDRDVPRANQEYFWFSIWGSSESVQRVDWAHTKATTPYISATLSSDSLSSWGGTAFETPMGTAHATACQELELAESRDTHESSNDPDSRRERLYEWGPQFPSLDSQVVVSEWRMSEVIGNLLLGIIGILSTVLIGLIPVTFRAREAHQRHIKKSS